MESKFPVTTDTMAGDFALAVSGAKSSEMEISRFAQPTDTATIENHRLVGKSSARYLVN